MAFGVFATTAAAQNTPFYANRSHGFNLVLQSSNKTVDGIRLTACHTGAAEESLCTYSAPADSVSDIFYYNYTTEAGSTTGLLTWNLQAQSSSGEITESEPLALQYDRK